MAENNENNSQVGALELIFQRNKFYYQNYRNISAVLVALLVINVFLVYFSLHIIDTAPKHRYFATGPSGAYIENPPLENPLFTEDQIKNWAIEAGKAAYTFDFVNYKGQLQDSRLYFTKVGFANYLKALYESNNINAVKAKKLVVSAVPLGAPKIEKQGVLDSAYAWQILVPMRLLFQSANEEVKQDVVMTMLVTRVPTLESREGLGINQLLVVDLKSLQR